MSTTVTADQLRSLWAGRIGRIDRGDDLPPVTQSDLGALASQVDTDDDGFPLVGQWEVLADQLNGAAPSETDGSGRQDDAAATVEAAARLVDDAMRDRDEAIRAAINVGVPVSRIAEAAGLSVPRIYQIRDGRR
ncbi:hypothetical protein FDG2_0723 [Candidatus Protofrankia californiensis]|uniref:Uncharacterized protein n=1 Tax=Candidatus Protofrankia californiensis TaxID=1839754 RepID=A0A1C3NU58_9ACTN|nr:hypothetical protein FDG2_0723 [Candidatus Protofrankia californiensis]